MKTVFILEDEVIISLFLKKLIERKGLNVLGTSTNGIQALEIILKDKPDIVIIDVSLKGSINGIEVANRISEIYYPKIVFITGLDEHALQSVKADYSYLRKPFDNKELLNILLS
ncbi:MAG: response regulator [Ignavibacteriaceae bacterium]|nr:response regulator [Ignavibacteriaceae bacterium]